MAFPFSLPHGRKLALGALALTTLSGCYSGGVYGASSYPSAYACGGNYYDNDPYSYDDGYGYDCYDQGDYRGGFLNIGFGGGWYDDYYYPGYGTWIYDRRNIRRRLSGHHLNYWGGRRAYHRHIQRNPSYKHGSRPRNPPHQARPDRPNRGDGQVRPGRPNRGDGQVRPGRPNRGDGQVRPDRPNRGEGQARPDRPNRGESQARPTRPNRGEAQARPTRPNRSERQARPARSQRSERQARPARSQRSERQARPARQSRSDSQPRSSRSRSDRRSPR